MKVMLAKLIDFLGLDPYFETRLYRPIEEVTHTHAAGSANGRFLPCV